MKFINRTAELKRLDRLLKLSEGGLGVLWGRRRIGKTRLLVEWCRKHDGLYTVADLSTPAVHRRYLASAVATVLRGFDQVEYPDWRTLLDRLAGECRARGWRGPLVFDELPYWVSASPGLPSVLQRWVDHEAKQAGLVVVLAGSSQHMMQGLTLDAVSPLYGRAREAMALRPLAAGRIGEALHLSDPKDCVMAHAVWGGIPRYWELAEPYGAELESAIDECVLDPLGPLHAEPDRLLVEELPPANALRPILDVVGSGAHRLKEIAARMGQQPTALSRALVRLQEMGLLQRQTPFGSSERSGKRTLYRIRDPFFRLWFRIVASHRAFLAAARPAQRRSLWRKFGPGLVAEGWEDLCRAAVPRLAGESGLDKAVSWLPARRFWHGKGPEWDVVSLSEDGEHVLIGEAKWSGGKKSQALVRGTIADLLKKGAPHLREIKKAEIVRAVFVPDARPGVIEGVHVVNAEQVLGAQGEDG